MVLTDAHGESIQAETHAVLLIYALILYGVDRMLTITQFRILTLF